MKEYFFQKRGIYYRTSEFQSDRATLVWIHGLSGSLSAWFPYEKAFAGYNLLTLDLRGHGKSVRPRHYEEYALSLAAEDVYELLLHLHIGRCILISHSFGTLVALELAHMHPEKVSALVFMSPTAFLKQTRWLPLIQTLGRGLVALLRVLPFRTNKRGHVDYSIFTYTGDWDPRRIIRDIYNTTVHSYVYGLMQAYAGDYDNVWETISIPTLIIHSTKDSIVPIRLARQLAKEIPASTFVPLEGAHHIVVINNIQEVTRAIKTFLASLATNA